MIDSHLHLQDPDFAGKVDEIMRSLRAIGVTRLVVNGTSEADWSEVARIADDYPEVIPCFGIHPWWEKEASPSWRETLRGMLEKYPKAGVGEVGVDRWVRGHDIDRQRRILRDQLDLAREMDRPVMLHCLRAWGHLGECLDQSSYCRPFLLHSFGGPSEVVEEYMERGAYFSLSGYFFREDKKSKLDAWELVPTERILLETDAPDMLPPEKWIEVPWEGESERKAVNHPANLRGVYGAFAAWKGWSEEQLSKQVEENFTRFLLGWV